MFILRTTEELNERAVILILQTNTILFIYVDSGAPAGAPDLTQRRPASAPALINIKKWFYEIDAVKRVFGTPGEGAP